MVVAAIGGVMALQRKHYKWALGGAICSILFPFLGIPAVILLVRRKGEFEEKEQEEEEEQEDEESEQI